MLLSKIKEKLNIKSNDISERNLELEQAFIRVAIVTIICVFFFIAGYFFKKISHEKLITYFVFIAPLFLATAIAIIISIKLKIPQGKYRKIAGIFSDNFMCSFVLCYIGDIATPVIFVYLWLATGYGFRFGVKYLIVSSVISIVSFAVVAKITPYWHDKTLVVVSILLMFTLIPLYLYALINKLNKAIAREKMANRAKSAFLANTSHELRTPLNGILGMTDLLKLHPLSLEQHEQIATISASSYRLLSIINTILDYSKIESDKLVLKDERFNLYEAACKLYSMFHLQAKQKDIKLSLHIDPDVPKCISGDSHYFGQVIINLIGNAIKFTPKGNIWFFIQYDKENNELYCEVKDTGIGISMEDQERIFDHFQQAESSTKRRFEGTGLGTSIAKNIVEEMNGEIGVTSKPNVGSSFWFKIPIQPVDQENIPDQHDSKLLVVSDRDIEIPASYMPNYFTSVTELKFYLSEIPDDREIVIALDGNLFTEDNPLDTLMPMIPSRNNTKLILVYDIDKQNNAEKIEFLTALPVENIPSQLPNVLDIADSALKTSKVVSINSKQSAKGVAKTEKTKSLHIFVAEDNQVNQQVMESMLDTLGHTCTIIGDGDEALDYLVDHAEDFDLVMLDMSMPGVDGIDVFKAFKFAHSERNIPVMMVTANATESAKEECLDLGVNYFLTKPITLAMLKESIGEFFDLTIEPGQKPIEQLTQIDESQAPANDESDVIDMELFKANSAISSSKEFMPRLVSCFIEDGEQLLVRLNESGKSKNFIQYREILHGLKGLSMQLGATELTHEIERGQEMTMSEWSKVDTIIHSIEEAHYNAANRLMILIH